MSTPQHSIRIIAALCKRVSLLVPLPVLSTCFRCRVESHGGLGKNEQTIRLAERLQLSAVLLFL